MALGSWNTATPVMGIAYHKELRILGIHFARTIRASALLSWAQVSRNVRTQAQEAYYRDLRLVCKTCAFHDALQAGKQNQVHRTPLIWRLLNREDCMLFDLPKQTSANRATYKTRCLTVLLSVVTEENNGHGQGSGWR
jgi:hypothetical protein